ncbi:glycosyltransferase [Maioricimonas sp. JC845]|uniref:glycosyltransferase n=1 Tax=Maioricimonas sp. JC845 TaxID=3232138 RepID=UPI003457C43F
MSTIALKRVLFVSYLFPPVGGVGVHRVTKFVKYLPAHGWHSSVLTVANPSVPLIDDSLTHDIAAGTIIRHARTLEPGYGLKRAVAGGSRESRGLVGSAASGLKGLARNVANTVLQPDAQVLWRPAAVREGLALLRDVRHDAIIATGPPFSSFWLGATLSARSRLPLILDYRDEWDISNAYWENKRQGWCARRFQQWLQAHCARAADCLLATTPASADALADVARNAGSDARTASIYNGFDPDDFSDQTRPVREDFGNGTSRFRMSFVGTLWNLNSIEPLVKAIEQLANRNPHLLDELELVCAGRRTDAQEALLDRLTDTPCHVVRLPFVDHTRATELMATADSLLLLNADRPQTHRIINAKTFEYMAARRPMFVIAPEGDLWDVVRDLPGTVLCRPNDTSSIAEALAHELERHRCGINYDDAVWDISRFERRELAGELASLLDEVVISRVTSRLCLAGSASANHGTELP